MRRRDFITGIAGSAAAWPLTAGAQQPKLPRIGILIPANPEPFWNEFQQGLRERDYIEGQTIQFEFRSAEGKPNLLRGLADELVRLKVDIIVASQTPAVTAARQATTEIPIVMAPAGDPVGTGLISSLARPGGNITGLSSTTAELGAKTLELIRDVLPSTRRVAVLANAVDPFSRPFSELIEDGGRTLGIASIAFSRGREAGRPAGGAADAIRAHRQSQDRQGARHYHSDDGARARRRSDRVSLLSLLHLLRSGSGTKRTFSTLDGRANPAGSQCSKP
jgi:ABC transporter substrate binding protein